MIRSHGSGPVIRIPSLADPVSEARLWRRVPPPALEHGQVDVDAETRPVGGIGVAAFDPERARQKILRVIKDGARVAVGAEIRHSDTEMDLRRGPDAELRHAADHAGHPRRLAEGK